jgi:hypothetical protein
VSRDATGESTTPHGAAASGDPVGEERVKDNRDDKTGPAWLGHVLTGLILASFIATAVVLLSSRGIEQLPYLVMLMTMIAVGWLLVWKRPGHPLGWLLLSVPGVFCVSVPIALLGEALLPTAPALAAWLLWFGGNREDTWSWIPPVWVLLTQIPLRFPDGRLPSRRWRWFAWYTIFVIVVTCAIVSMSAKEAAPGIPSPTYVALDEGTRSLLTATSLGLLLSSFLGSIVSLFVRYRRADSVGRAQLRWVFWAAFIAVALLVGAWTIPAGPLTQFQTTVLLGYALIPVAIVIAVLRYHLYEIDRIISRSASYAIVTLVVLGSYALVVVALGAILPELPSVAVALATLAAAALFLPVLRTVQRVIDRRFDRARYDGQKVIDAFGERLRNGADPHLAAAGLGAAVESALQPTAIGLWVAE